MNRPLNPQEKALTEKNIKRLDTELEYQRYLARHATEMISHGLRLNYERQLDEWLQKKRDINQRISELEYTRLEAATQLREGVPQKQSRKERRKGK